MQHGPVRLFVAVEPSVEAVEALRALPRPEVAGLRWTREPTWHVTLRFLGELADPQAVVAAVADSDLGPAVRARLGPATTWLSRKVLVVPVSGLEDLAARVRTATADIGQAPDDRGFDGHLTLARRRSSGGAEPASVPIDVGFSVGEVVLFSSTLSSTGATHEVLHRWELGS